MMTAMFPHSVSAARLALGHNRWGDLTPIRRQAIQKGQCAGFRAAPLPNAWDARAATANHPDQFRDRRGLR